MKNKEEMQEALDAGYTLCIRKDSNAIITQINGVNIASYGKKIEKVDLDWFNPEEIEIQRPDLTKPQTVLLDHKGWAWEDDPEKAEERCLLHINKDYYITYWSGSKRTDNLDVEILIGTKWKNFSWENPSKNKTDITFSLTEQQIADVKALLGEEQ
jgi:hypothetical protein